MHEALIQNWIRRIPWADFWGPVTTRQKCIKWSIILLVLILGISIFHVNLDELQAYEYACENPIIVEAERKVVYIDSVYSDVFISYTYDGVRYEDIFYRTYKSPSIKWDGIETLTVAVDPHDPGMPIRNMFNEGPVVLAIVLWSLGLSMLVYGIALEFPGFRQWRVACSNRPSFLDRPYGKPIRNSDHPDYPKDTFFIWLPIFFICAIIFGFLFPYTFSP